METLRGHCEGFFLLSLFWLLGGFQDMVQGEEEKAWFFLKHANRWQTEQNPVNHKLQYSSNE